MCLYISVCIGNQYFDKTALILFKKVQRVQKFKGQSLFLFSLYSKCSCMSPYSLCRNTPIRFKYVAKSSNNTQILFSFSDYICILLTKILNCLLYSIIVLLAVVCMCMCVYAHVCTYGRMYVCAYVCKYVCTYVCMCLYMYVCMCVRMYVCM